MLKVTQLGVEIGRAWLPSNHCLTDKKIHEDKSTARYTVSEIIVFKVLKDLVGRKVAHMERSDLLP